MTFKNLALIKPLQAALEEIKYTTPTPIQEQAIPIVLENHDLLGIAQTGTGKTAAFCLPILNNLASSNKKAKSRRPRSLILTPTRELAIQIHDNLKLYGKNLDQKYQVIFGGVSQGRQVRELQKAPTVVVATPGRLLDLISQNHLFLDQVESFVLDEVDRMLDMGFLRDIKKILNLLPEKRHNLFFSATLPQEIEKLAKTILHNPKKVEITPESTTVERIEQTAMYVEKSKKIDLLIHHIQKEQERNPDVEFKALVFAEMKHVADRISEKLIKADISAAAIHGNKSQNARQRALNNFKEGDVQVLVATDIASRGIDVDGVTHVINYELSNIIESYVHRIGRTARAGHKGKAVSFVTDVEKSYLKAIEKNTKQEIEVVTDHPFHSEEAMQAPTMSVGKAKTKLEAERRAKRPPRNNNRRNDNKSGGGARNSKRRPSGKSGGNKPRRSSSPR